MSGGAATFAVPSESPPSDAEDRREKMAMPAHDAPVGASEAIEVQIREYQRRDEQRVRKLRKRDEDAAFRCSPRSPCRAASSRTARGSRATPRPPSRATTMVAMHGSSTTITAVRISVTSAISGVATIGNPRPSAPCMKPARACITRDPREHERRAAIRSPACRPPSSFEVRRSFAVSSGDSAYDQTSKARGLHGDTGKSVSFPRRAVADVLVRSRSTGAAVHRRRPRRRAPAAAGTGSRRDGAFPAAGGHVGRAHDRLRPDPDRHAA